MGINFYNGSCNRQAACLASLMTGGINMMNALGAKPNGAKPETYKITVPMVETGAAVYEEICERDRQCVERVVNTAINDDDMQPTVARYMDAVTGKTQEIPDKASVIEMMKKFK